MICSNCGMEIPDDSIFCENCGAQLDPVEPETEAAEDIAEENEFREIEELEAMEEVETPEVYDEDYEDEDYREEVIDVEYSELPEEAQLPDFGEMELQETGQPEGSETEWLESFQQLEPKKEDWEEEPAEEAHDEYVEEPEPAEEEYFEEPEPAEEAHDEYTEEPEPAEEEHFEEPEPVEEETHDEYVEEPEPVEEETLDEYVEEPEPVEEETHDEYVEEPEPVEEEHFEEPEPVEEETLDEYVEEPGPVEEEPVEEPAEPSESEDAAPEEEESRMEEAKEAISDSAKKVGNWLGSLGKSVHTGTGWAVGAAREKASKFKDEKKAEREKWAEEDEGELELGYNFWYKSNQPDAASRYEGMDLEKENQSRPTARTSSGEKAKDRSDSENGTKEETESKRASKKNSSDAITYVALKEKAPEKAEADDPDASADGETQSTQTGGEKQPVNKLKVTVIALIIAALLGAGGIYGSKVYTENKQEDAYQASMAKAEKMMESKDYPSAENIYSDLLKEYPDRAELYESLTRAYMADEKYDDAKNTLNEGIARTGKSKAYTALAADLDALTSTEWQEPFRRVLADNEWAVRSYEDENGSCVALCDITGDKRPEMLYFTQEYYGYGVLHICTYENEKAREVTYECKNRGTQYDDAFYDVESDASSYVVYKSKTNGKFGIYESFQRGIEAWQTTNRYTMSGTDCTRDSVIEALIETDYRVTDDEDGTGNNEYYKDDKKVKYNTYLDEFKAVLNDMDEIIITSQSSAGDKEIWNRIMDMEEAAMTYDGAMKILDEDAR